MFKTVIVDDEELSRERLKCLLHKHTAMVDVVAEAKNGVKAFDVLNALQPDLVFLDVRMPGLSGFELVQRIRYQPIIIFTTAYHEYALDAFSTNSVAYLLKPILQHHVDKALAKLQSLFVYVEKCGVMSSHQDFSSQHQYTSHLACKTGKTVNLIEVNDIYYLQSRNTYVRLYTRRGEFSIESSLASLETRLNGEQFIRVHRNTMVNCAYIGQIFNNRDGTLELTMLDDQFSKITVSKGYVDKIKVL